MQKDIPNYGIYGDFDADFSLNPVHVDDVKKSSEKNSWNISAHRHDALCHLGYFSSGEGRMVCSNVEAKIEAPCFCFIPVGEVHSFSMQKNIEGA